MQSSINQPLSNANLTTTNAIEIEKHQSKHNLRSEFCGRKIQTCKAIFNGLVNTCMILGATGAVVAVAAQPIVTHWSQPHLDKSYYCYKEAEARIDAYNDEMLRICIYSSVPVSALTTSLVAIYYAAKSYCTEK